MSSVEHIQYRCETLRKKRDGLLENIQRLRTTDPSTEEKEVGLETRIRQMEFDVATIEAEIKSLMDKLSTSEFSTFDATDDELRDQMQQEEQRRLDAEKEVIHLRDQLMEIEKERNEEKQQFLQQIMRAEQAAEQEKQKRLETEKELQDIRDQIHLQEVKSDVGEKIKIVAGITFVLVEGGVFEIGDVWGDGQADEKPVHAVTLNDFWMSKYLITNQQFCQFLNEYGSDKVDSGEYFGQQMVYENQWGMKKYNNKWLPQSDHENHPAVFVTWFGAYEFCQHYRFRLPTESEWEYAARSKGQPHKWAGTSDPTQLDAYMWYLMNSHEKTHSVGQRRPNSIGLFDMSGNVWEWCQDWFDERYYVHNSNENPMSTNETGYRVLRGGSWFDKPYFCRTSLRNGDSPELGNVDIGFRVVLDS